MAGEYPLTYAIQGKTLQIDNLSISIGSAEYVSKFRKASRLPKKLGVFPLTPVAQYQSAFQKDANGVFFGAQEGDALYIHFASTSKTPYMVRIYAGDVNVVSGRQEPMPWAYERRIQDYLLVEPGVNFCVYGFLIGHYSVRQFVATPSHAETLMGMQLPKPRSGKGLRFEVTPLRPEHDTDYFVRVKFLENKSSNRALLLPVHDNAPMRLQSKLSRFYHGTVKGQKHDLGFVSTVPERITQRIDDECSPYSANLEEDCRGNKTAGFVFHPKPKILYSTSSTYTFDNQRWYRQFYDNEQVKTRERILGPQTASIDAGNLIKQTLNWDPWPDLWDQKKTTVVNVHVVSLQRYKAITGDDGGVEGAILHDESRSWPLRDRSGPKEGFWCMRDDPLAVASNKDAEKGW